MVAANGATPLTWSRDASGEYTRAMAGTELFQMHALEGVDQLATLIHASMMVDVDTKIDQKTVADFKAAIFNAWIRLRVKYPLLIVEPRSPNFSYAYRHKEDYKSVLHWAQSTLFISHADDITSESLGKKRTEISILPIPDKDGRAAQLHCYLSQDPTNAFVTKVGFILRVAHTIVDGPGASILLSELRQDLANPGPSPEKLDWSDPAFKKSQLDSLPINASDAVSPEYETGKDIYDIEKEVDQLRLMKHNTDLAFPVLNDNKSCLTEHTKVALTSAQTIKLRQIARKHGMSVSPILAAAAVARGVLEYAVRWPPSPEDLYVSNWPVDSRPGLEERFQQGGVLLAMNVSQSVLQVGKHFNRCLTTTSDHNDATNGYTKQVAEDCLSSIIFALANDSKANYQMMRSAQYRAAMTKALPEFMAAFGKAVVANEVPIGKSYLRCFSDAILDRHVKNELPIITPDGISTTILDLDMSTNIEGPMLLLRTWLFQDQTYLTADWSTAFWTRESAERFVDLWRKDVERFIKEGEA